MPDLYTSADGGGGQSIFTPDSDGTDSFVACRSDTSGNYSFNTSTVQSAAIAARTYTFGAAPQTRAMWLNRSFFNFDTSGITALPDTATLKLYGYNAWTDDIIAVKHNNTGTLNGAGWDLIDGCTSQLAASDGAGTGTLASCATNYSSELASGAVNQYNDLSLNETARTDMRDNDELRIAVVQYDNDYLDITPYPGPNSKRCGIFYSDHATSAYHPYIEYSEPAVDPSFPEKRFISTGGDILINGGKLTIK